MAALFNDWGILGKPLMKFSPDPPRPDASQSGRGPPHQDAIAIPSPAGRLGCPCSTLFFNPGYSGKPRLNLDRSVAVPDLTGDDVTAEFYPLG
jgi:hypothetical protein